MNQARRLPGDWYDGLVPDNTSIHETAHLESAYSFYLYRSELDEGVRMGEGSSAYLGTMFDIGTHGSVRIGSFTLVNGAWFICDRGIEVGDYTFISWNVLLMDSYRVSHDPAVRREDLLRVPHRRPRTPQFSEAVRPLAIGSNVWIGFDVCVLPGVRIGDGSIIGARSVVADDVPPYCIAAGNPARVLRQLETPRK